MEESSKKVQYWVTFAVGLTSMAHSASYSWATPIIPKLSNNETDFSVTDDEISWMIVAASPGIILGNIFSQYPSDIFGRRITLIVSTLPFFVGTMFILFAKTAWMLYIARFFWGVGTGIFKTVSVIYLAEIASKEIRGSLQVGMKFMFNLGNVLVVLVGTYASYSTVAYLFLVLSTVCFIACWCIPESPYYLLKENKVDDARQQLLKLNGYKENTILEQKLTEIRIHVREDMQRSTTLKELFTGKQYRKALIIASGIRIFHAMSGVVTIQQYLGGVMQETKSSISVSTALIFYTALKFIVCMMSSVIVDRFGRRPLLIYSFIGAFLSYAVAGTCFYLQGFITINIFPNLFGNIIFIGITCFGIVSTIGFDILLNVVTGEIFPLNIKSAAMTSMNLLGSVVVLANIKSYQLVKDLTGLYGVFWFFGSACLFGAVFTYCLVPETKGKSLREIQIMLQGSLYKIELENSDQIEMKDVQQMLIPKQQEKENPTQITYTS